MKVGSPDGLGCGSGFRPDKGGGAWSLGTAFPGQGVTDPSLRRAEVSGVDAELGQRGEVPVVAAFRGYAVQLMWIRDESDPGWPSSSPSSGLARNGNPGREAVTRWRDVVDE